MIYDWYFIINEDDFNDLGLVSKSLDLVLGSQGSKTVLVTKGAALGFTCDGIFLSLGLNDRSPFEFEDRAIYKDENNNVWLGFLHVD
jgi:hypothetical protein